MNARAKRVLLDACVPEWLRRDLAEFDVQTARHADLHRLSDPQLLQAIEGRFDVLVTLDFHIADQNRVGKRPYGVVALRTRDQSASAFRAALPAIRRAILEVRPGEHRQIELGTEK